MGSSAFARHYLRNHCYFLFLRVMRCFSSPGSPSAINGVPGSIPAGWPIRKSAGQRVFAPRRGLSQLITSFFASESQGILHVPLSPFLCFSCNDPPRILLHGASGCSIRFFLLLVSSVRVCGRVPRFQYVNALFPVPHLRMVENNGFEPLTLCLQSRCSSQLS